MVRSYDSRHPQSGDFGFGWSLDFSDIRAQENIVYGKRWRTDIVGFPLANFCIELQGANTVTIALPDGKIYRFAPSVTPSCQRLEPIRTVQLAFKSIDGSGATLIPIDETEALVNGNWPGQAELLGLDTAEPVDPNVFQLTVEDGRVFQVSQENGLEFVVDRNDDSVLITATGIHHSKGASIFFDRDTLGRITKVVDEAGEERHYGYDANGDLVTSTDFSGHITRYEYDNEHRLTRIANGRDESLSMLVYDDEGRLIGFIDAEGQRTVVENEIANRRRVATDRLGNRTITEYNERGDVVAITDALSNTTHFTYDERGNLTSQTDPLGNTESYTYDSDGNRLSRTDALSNTWTTTYNSHGQVLSETDPLGRESHSTYDANGNLTQRVSASGARTSLTYDSFGGLTSYTDATSKTLQILTDQYGRLNGYVDGLGRTSMMTRQRNGEITSESFVADGSLIEYRYDRDADGRVTGATLPDGGRATAGYDDIGRLTSVLNTRGLTQSLEYNSNQEVAAFNDAYGSTTLSYDDESRVVAASLPTGSQVRRDLDPVGRPVTVAIGSVSPMTATYDAAGRIVSDHRPGVGVRVYDYDSVGNMRAVIRPDGGRTAFGYNAAGERTVVTDALGNEIHLDYDADGRGTAIQWPDGATASKEFDAAGRLVAEQNERGSRREFDYDVAGQLVAARDEAGGLTQFRYNDLGLVREATTAGANRMQFGYDSFGAVTALTMPWGGTQSLEYDRGGALTRSVDANGAEVRIVYDAAGRAHKWISDGGVVKQIEYDQASRISSVIGATETTTYTYDLDSRVRRIDSQDGLFVEYGYDGEGQLASIETASGTTSYEYDGNGSLVRVLDSAVGEAQYSYDPAGRLVEFALPDGSSTSFTLNSRGQPARVRTESSAGAVLRDERATYDAAGNPTHIEDVDYVVDYVYDDASRIISETRTGIGGGAVDYAYDADWNLTKMGDRSLSYDHLRVIDDGDWSYESYDSAGRPTRRSRAGVIERFTYDAMGQLVDVERTGALPNHVELSYDTGGLLTRVVSDGSGRKLLWNVLGEIPLLLEERRDNGTLLRRYIYGAHGLIAIETVDGQHIVHTDVLGSVRQITSADGDPEATYSYSAYGEQNLGASDEISSLRYASEYWVPELHLYYLRARFYDPTAGCFLTPDTIMPTPRFPTLYNPYLYARCNPVRFTDPTGHLSIAEINMGLTILGILSHEILNLGFLDGLFVSVPPIRSKDSLGTAFKGSVNVSKSLFAISASLKLTFLRSSVGTIKSLQILSFSRRGDSGLGRYAQERWEAEEWGVDQHRFSLRRRWP